MRARIQPLCMTVISKTLNQTLRLKAMTKEEAIPSGVGGDVVISGCLPNCFMFTRPISTTTDLETWIVTSLLLILWTGWAVTGTWPAGYLTTSTVIRAGISRRRNLKNGNRNMYILVI